MKFLIRLFGRLMAWLIALGVGYGALVMLGPSVTIDEARVVAPQLPGSELPGSGLQGSESPGSGLRALEAWLAEREDAVPDLRPQARKQIIWAQPEAPARTPLSVVYLHGYSATRVETAPLADSVAQALGANLYYTRLRGHGRDGAAMAEATVEDWLSDTREALAVARQIGERVVVIGTSTGATLALWAAADAPERDAIAALALISPNFGPADKRSTMLNWPGGGVLAELVLGPEYSWEPANEAQAAGWTTAYPTRALLPMMALVDFINQPKRLARVEVPTLFMHTPDDQVVDVAAIRRGFEALGSERRQIAVVSETSAPSRHVIAGDVLSPETTGPLARTIVEFVRTSAGG